MTQKYCTVKHTVLRYIPQLDTLASSCNEYDCIYIASAQLLSQGALYCNQQSDDPDEQARGESGEEKLP